MAYFPMFVDLSTKKCVIFGGGKVALRKIKTLLRYDAHIELISAQIIAEIRNILPEEKLHEIALHVENLSDNAQTESESIDCTDLESTDRTDPVYWLSQADFAIAATSSRQLNHRISSWCRIHHVPVDVIDAPEECSFLFPSVVKKGEISIGINTGARSPIVSKKIRREIEQTIPDYYGDIAQQLGQVRDYVKDTFSEESVRRAILKTVAAESFSRERILLASELEEIYRKSVDVS